MRQKSIKLRLIVAIGIGFLVLSAANLFAGTYYVSPTGTAPWSGGGNCTNIATPCRGDTAMDNAVAGDLIYFRGGEYYPCENLSSAGLRYYNTPCWNPLNSGSDGSEITFMAYPDETPIMMDGWSEDESGDEMIPIGAAGKNYIIWDGFEVHRISAGFSEIAFIFDNADYCTIKNSHIISDAVAGGSNYPLIRIGNSGTSNNYNKIQNNILQGGGTEEHDNNAGIQFYNASNTTIEYNTVSGVHTGLYDKHGGANNTWRYNFVYDCDTGFYREDFGSYTQSDTIYQNIFLNIADLGWRGRAASDNPTTISLYNNTFYNSSTATQDGIALTTDYFTADVYNNIVVNFAHGCRYPAGEEGDITTEENSFNSVANYRENYTTYNLAGFQALGWEANSEQISPGFVNAGGTSSYDYKLTAVSGNRNAGRDGVTRGAFITGNEQIGAAPNDLGSAPSAPNYLRIVTFGR